MTVFKSNLIKLLIISCLLNLYHIGYSQEKKMMSDGNIKTQVIWRESKKAKYKFQEIRFDRNGNRTEEIKYNPKGKVVFHKAYEYTNDLLTMEMELDSKGLIVLRSNYTYLKNMLVNKKHPKNPNSSPHTAKIKSV